MADDAEARRQRSSARAGRGWQALGVTLAAIVLFVVALVPRLASLDQHATADEDLTLIRSANVALALERQDWWGTYQIGHPEATVQLLVALRLGADALRPYAGDFLGPDSRTAARAPGYFQTLVQARQVMVPVHALLVVVAAVLAWRLWGSLVGALVGLLLALEPFLVAHGRILRTDALLAELMLVAVLAGLAFWSGRGGWWALALCSLATALALLTKTPALALLVVVPLVALVGPALTPGTALTPGNALSAGARKPLTPRPPLPCEGEGEPRRDSGVERGEGEAVGASFAAPAGGETGARETAGTAGQTTGGARAEADGASGEAGGAGVVAGGSRGSAGGASPARTGPRWIGVVAAVVVWMVGSAVLVVALWPAMWVRPLRAVERMAVYTQEKGGSPMDAGGFFLGSPVADPGPLYYAVALPLRLSPLVLIGLGLWLLLRAPRARRGVGLVLLIGLGLAAVLALLPKKADRYILPAIPFLAVVAAIGIAGLAERWRRFSPAVALTLVATVETALLVVAWPYPLAAYNPLLGGGTTATALISVGWGEGLDQLGPILDERPDAAYLTVSTPYPEVLQAQIVGRAVDLDAYDVADYAVRYVAAEQRHLTSKALDAALAGREPLHRVQIADIPYAELYELDRPTFAGNIEARQLEISPSVTPRRGWVTLRLALGPASAEGRLGGTMMGLTPFVTPIDVEFALANAADPSDVEATVTRALLADGTVSEVRVRAPNGLGRYVSVISLRDPSSGVQYAVTSWPIGGPRLPGRLVFPSLTVRVQ